MAPNSPSKKHKRLRIFAGPNGSGKTTILKLIDDSYDLGYKNSLALLKDAVPYCYRTFIFDNSEDQALLILEVTKDGSIEILREEIPHWVDGHLISHFHL